MEAILERGLCPCARRRTEDEMESDCQLLNYRNARLICRRQPHRSLAVEQPCHPSTFQYARRCISFQHLCSGIRVWRSLANGCRHHPQLRLARAASSAMVGSISIRTDVPAPGFPMVRRARI
jgi:hypothetical protein